MGSSQPHQYLSQACHRHQNQAKQVERDLPPAVAIKEPDQAKPTLKNHRHCPMRLKTGWGFLRVSRRPSIPAGMGSLFMAHRMASDPIHFEQERIIDDMNRRTAGAASRPRQGSEGWDESCRPASYLLEADRKRIHTDSHGSAFPENRSRSPVYPPAHVRLWPVCQRRPAFRAEASV